MEDTEPKCTFSASGRTLFRHDSRRYVFSTCPVITSERCTAVFTAGTPLCIVGPCSSGKTLIVMHVLADVISTYGMCESTVFLDFDLSFDMTVFRHILLSQIVKYGTNDEDVEAILEESMQRLVYVPIYHVRDAPALIVALDVYLQSSDVHVLVVDSLISKSGNDDDDVVGTSLYLLKWLYKRHGLLLVYTKREGNGRTVPFQISTVSYTLRQDDNNIGTPISSSSALDNAEFETTILTFGMPIDWMASRADGTLRPAGVMIEQGPHPTDVPATGNSEHADNISMHIAGFVPEMRAQKHRSSPRRRPGATLCLLPCRRASPDSSGHIASIFRPSDKGMDLQLQLMGIDRSKHGASVHCVRHLVPLSSEFDRLEYESRLLDPESQSDFDDIQTQDLIASEQLMIDHVTDKIDGRVTYAASLPTKDLLSRSTLPAVDCDVLHDLCFGLFRINHESALNEQIFTLHS